MEQIQVMLNYPQVYTDMLFESVPTVALEMRCGTHLKSNNDNGPSDGDDTLPISSIIHQQKNFPSWSQLHDPELLILQSLLNSHISVDIVFSFLYDLSRQAYVFKTLDSILGVSGEAPVY